MPIQKKSTGPPLLSRKIAEKENRDCKKSRQGICYLN